MKKLYFIHFILLTLFFNITGFSQETILSVKSNGEIEYKSVDPVPLKNAIIENGIMEINANGPNVLIIYLNETLGALDVQTKLLAGYSGAS